MKKRYYYIEAMDEELKPQFDNAKSFYRRAYVEKTHTGYLKQHGYKAENKEQIKRLYW